MANKIGIHKSFEQGSRLWLIASALLINRSYIMTVSFFYKLHSEGVRLGVSFEVHVLASGSDGNCTAVCSEDITILIDAGLSGKQLTGLIKSAGIDPKQINAILLTHEHVDHVRGAGVLSRRYNIPICCNPSTMAASDIGEVESKILFNTLEEFSIGHLKIKPLPITHHAADPNAFFISTEKNKFLLATDLGKVNNDVFESLGEADFAVIEANHDLRMLDNGPYPIMLKRLIRSERGHLSNIDCAHALWASGYGDKKVFLAHLSKNNNIPDLAIHTVSSLLGCCDDKVDCLRTPGDTRTITL